MHLLSTLIEFLIKFSVFLMAKSVKLIYWSKPYFGGLAMEITRGTAIFFSNQYYKINKTEILHFSNCTFLPDVGKLNFVFLSFVHIHMMVSGSNVMSFFIFYLEENAYIRDSQNKVFRLQGVLFQIVSLSSLYLGLYKSSNTELSPLLLVKTFDFSEFYHSNLVWFLSHPIVSTDMANI